MHHPLRYMLKRCFLTWQGKKFLWSQYYYLDNVVEASGITSTRETREFKDLYEQICGLLRANDDLKNCCFTRQTLKVFLKVFIKLIFRTKYRISMPPKEKATLIPSLAPMTRVARHHNQLIRHSQTPTLLSPMHCHLPFFLPVWKIPLQAPPTSTPRPQTWLRGPRPRTLLRTSTFRPRPTSAKKHCACTGVSSAVSKHLLLL
jgi:hypothetical protein